VRNVIVDTGPLTAFLNRNDTFHSWALARMAESRPPLVTCEAVLSEAAYLLRRLRGGERLMELLDDGLVRVEFKLNDQANAVRTLMKKYRSVPMDLTDACLVRMSELQSDSVLLTIDTAFRDIYRRHGRKTISCVLPPGLKPRTRRKPRS
jgi:predicted nucleic acid-binding protein